MFSLFKAVKLQETAKTVGEAKRRLSDSCARCNRASFCKEELCHVVRAHKRRVEYLEATDPSKNRGTVVYVSTRAYSISPLHAKTKVARKAITDALKNEEQFSEVERIHLRLFDHLLKGGNYGYLRDALRRNGYIRKGRQETTAITPIINKLKDILKEVF